MNKIVLVTGAGGFLGGWVTESFHLTGFANVRAGVRRWNSAARIARFPVELVRCDVLNPDDLDVAMQGVDAVVHCAVGNDQTTVAGTQNVLTAAVRHGVRRIVYVSSIAVYGKKATGLIDESHPTKADRYRYAVRKLRAERVCREFMSRGAPVVILRPTIIYGPFSVPWVIDLAERLRSGQWGVFGLNGDGTCNLVYVTDVVRAIAGAIEVDDAVGETFNVNGEKTVTWNEYFELLNRALGGEPLKPLSARRLKIIAVSSGPLRRARRVLLSQHRGKISRLYKSGTYAAWVMNHVESRLRTPPTLEQLKLFRLKAYYSIEKANRLLGYIPEVTPNHGITLSANWLKHHGQLGTR